MQVVRTGLMTLGFVLACGGGTAGGGGGAEPPAFGSVAFTTWEDGSNRLKFKTDDKVELTWRNMSGSAVHGTFTEDGDELHITFEPSDNWGGKEAKIRKTGECSMAWYWWVDGDGEVHDDDSDMYERKVPKCR